MTNEVLGRGRDIIPVGGVELIVPSHDLLEQLSIALVVERRVATQSAGGRVNQLMQFGTVPGAPQTEGKDINNLEQ